MGKSLHLQAKKGRPAMAGLLLIALGCTPLLGCLFPQDEQVINELPPKRNGPLKIVEGRWSPLTQRTTFFNTNSPVCISRNTPFSLTVEDDDLADVVSSRWFIDKTNDGSSLPFEPSPVRSSGSSRRTVTAPSALAFSSALANLSAGTTHLLTVYVADSTFQESVGGEVSVSRAPRTLPDGTTATDTGSFDSFTWVLDVEACN